MFTGGKVAEGLHGVMPEGDADTVSHVGEEGGNEVDPVGASLGEVDRQEPANDVYVDQVIHITNNEWVRFRLCQGFEGMEGRGVTEVRSEARAWGEGRAAAPKADTSWLTCRPNAATE